MATDSGRTQVRLVDTQSETYQVARQYMIRLEPDDLADAGQVERLAAAGHMQPEEFRRYFS